MDGRRLTRPRPEPLPPKLPPVGMWEKKCWGRVWHCFHSERVAVSYLELEAGWRCSIHYHRSRANYFFLVSGMVLIELWRSAVKPLGGQLGPPSRTIELKPGGNAQVSPLIPHRFRVREPGRMIEVYTGDPVSLGDIVRFDEGGQDLLPDKMSESCHAD